jgi:hypothetical protein
MPDASTMIQQKIVIFAMMGISSFIEKGTS